MELESYDLLHLSIGSTYNQSAFASGCKAILQHLQQRQLSQSIGHRRLRTPVRREWVPSGLISRISRRYICRWGNGGLVTKVGTRGNMWMRISWAWHMAKEWLSNWLLLFRCFWERYGMWARGTSHAQPSRTPLGQEDHYYFIPSSVKLPACDHGMGISRTRPHTSQVPGTCNWGKLAVVSSHAH